MLNIDEVETLNGFGLVKYVVELKPDKINYEDFSFSCFDDAVAFANSFMGKKTETSHEKYFGIDEPDAHDVEIRIVITTHVSKVRLFDKQAEISEKEAEFCTKELVFMDEQLVSVNDKRK